MILIIDNYDSFTYNLYQQVEALGTKTEIYKNDKVSIQQIKKIKPKKIIISPGPGRPENAGISKQVIKQFHQTTPILGVCLGHQCIGEVFGSETIHAKEILHGKTSNIYHTEDKLFEGLKNPISAARYHSLVIDKVPAEFTLTAWDQDNEIMAIHHNKYPVFGIQFHPESILTEHGNKLMHNFLYEI